MQINEVFVIIHCSEYVFNVYYIFTERRKVSVNDVMPGELSGYLYARLRIKQNVTWQKRWFVLNGNCLYGFKTNDAKKAECFICLTGFTATIAQEVRKKLTMFTKC